MNKSYRTVSLKPCNNHLALSSAASKAHARKKRDDFEEISRHRKKRASLTGRCVQWRQWWPAAEKMGMSKKREARDPLLEERGR